MSEIEAKRKELDNDLKLNCSLGVVKPTNQEQYYWMKLDIVKLLLKNEREMARKEFLEKIENILKDYDEDKIVK